MLPSLPFLVKRDIPAESIPARSRYQNFREAKASGTAVLIVVNLYIFFVRVQEPNLVTWGGNLGKLTLNGEAWRLVTAMFLHASLVHLAGNLICLRAWGRVTEAALGTARFLLAYFASGVLANLAGAWVHPDVISVGASGAIAGILGLMVVIWLKGDARIGPKDILANIALNTIISLHPRVDWVAHLAGFVAGLGFGSVLFPASFVQRPVDSNQLPLNQLGTTRLPMSVSFREPMDFPKGTIVYRTPRRLVAILPNWTLIADDGTGGVPYDNARDYLDKTGDEGECEWTWIKKF